MKSRRVLTVVGVFLLALAAAVYAGDEGQKADAPVVFDSPQEIGTTAKCPVMGNVFTIKKETLQSEVGGKHVYFCCSGCKPTFDADPGKYLPKQLVN